MLQLERDGAEQFSGVCAVGLHELVCRIGAQDTTAGVRLFANPALADWLANGPISMIVREHAGERARAVRAILFDKTEAANWALGWHQDRTIAVRQRVEHSGFRHWTIKSGVQHVEPPFSIIEGLVTTRIHIDSVSDRNAPLLIAPGSHRLGLIPETDIDRVVDQCGTVSCLASPGDVWLYQTPILHASKRSLTSDRRRVLQVDFSSAELPAGLEWLGVG